MAGSIFRRVSLFRTSPATIRFHDGELPGRAGNTFAGMEMLTMWYIVNMSIVMTTFISYKYIFPFFFHFNLL